ncbi:hypothetical protein [Streptomyces niveus]|uniref:hypothetical protein n=1 Tax=Streptomyces niveus TaxID=193462 RepID=UPI0034122FA4
MALTEEGGGAAPRSAVVRPEGGLMAAGDDTEYVPGVMRRQNVGGQPQGSSVT